MNLEQLIDRLDETFRTPDEFDEYVARLLNAPEYDTLTGQTHRTALDGFGVLERDVGGRVRKRPGFVADKYASWAEAENAKIKARQAAEEKEHLERERRQAEERDVRWQAEKAVIVGVIDERLRHWGLIDTPAADAGEE